MKKNLLLSGNALKIIAAIFMVIDHVGLMFFPRVIALRAIGRLAFPIFAFFISEGVRYTRSKLRYFLKMSVFGAVCQAFYAIFTNANDVCVFVTFAVSILLIMVSDGLKIAIYVEDRTRVKLLRASLLLIVTYSAVLSSVILLKINLDYGITGALVPVLISLAHPPKNAPDYWSKIDTPPVKLALFTLGLVILALDNRPIQYFSLISVALIALYSGKRGKLRLKYFFYLFYPLHLVILQGILYLVSK